MRLRLIPMAVLGLIAGGEALAACPPVPDQSARLASLIDQLQAAESEAEARPLSNGLWEIWATAPDARSQELLDHGMSRRELADYEAAAAAFDALVAYCPHYAEGYNQRAFIAFLRRDYAAALPDLEAALARNPQHVAARAGLALTLMGLDRHDDAQAALRQAVRLNPWLPERSLLTEPDGEPL